MNEYALYKGDELIEIGTVKEIARNLGLKESTIRHYGKKAHIKRSEKRKGGNFKRLVKLEEGLSNG